MNTINNGNDRFWKISEKIAKLNWIPTASPEIKTNVESKITEISDSFHSNYDIWEQKYEVLNIQFVKIAQVMEKYNKEKQQKRVESQKEMANWECKIKKEWGEYRESLMNKVNVSLKTMEMLILKQAQERRNVIASLISGIVKLKEMANQRMLIFKDNINEDKGDSKAELPAICEKINEKFNEVYVSINEEKNKRDHLEKIFVEQLGEVIEKIKKEFNNKRVEREEFESNVFSWIEDTWTKLAQDNYTN